MVQSYGWCRRVVVPFVSVIVVATCFTSAAIAAPRAHRAKHDAGAGLWLVADNGRIQALGSAESFAPVDGDWSRRHVAVAAAATPSGHGLWILAADGSVLPVGDATAFAPALASVRHDGPDAVGIAATSDGGGYLVAFADGAVRAYGDAASHGSANVQRGDRHAIVAIAMTPTGGGYWLVGSDAQVYAFGDAVMLRPSPFRFGDDEHVVAVATTPTGHGLWLAEADGSIDTLGDASSLPTIGRRLDHGPLAALAATPTGRGLWLAGAGGSVEARGDATPFGPQPAGGRGQIVAAVASAPMGTLTVTVSDLPAGASAAATVASAGATFGVIATETVRVPAGDYQVTARLVHASNATYFPTVTGSPSTVGPGTAATATVDYYDEVPDTTQVIPAAAVTGATGEPATGLTLTLNAASAPRLAIGNIVALGVTPATPYGLLGTVTALTANGSKLLVQTTPARLIDAISRGDLEADWSLASGSGGGSGVGTAAAGQTVPRQTQALRRGSSLPAIGTDIENNVSCDGGGSVLLTGRVDIQPFVKLRAHMGLSHTTVETAKFSAGVTESSELELAAQVAADCTLAPTPLGPPVEDVFTAFIGWLPVVVVVKIQLELSASGHIDAAVATSVSQNVTASAGVDYDHGSFTPFATFDPGFKDVPPAPTASAGIWVKVGPTLTALLYDVAGPEFNLDVGLDFEANWGTPPPTPWWTLSGTLDAGVGLVVPKLGLDWSDPSVISFRKILEQASAPAPISTEGDLGTDDTLDAVSPVGSKWVYYLVGDGFTEPASIDRVPADGSSPPEILQGGLNDVTGFDVAPDGTVYWATSTLENHGSDQVPDWHYIGRIWKDGLPFSTIDKDLVNGGFAAPSLLSLSADGSTLAFAFAWGESSNAIGTTEVHVVDTQDGSETYHQTFPDQRLATLELNADGSTLFSNFAGPTGSPLEKLELPSGTEFTPLTGLVGSAAIYKLSPVDPHTLVYESGTSGGQNPHLELHLVDLATGSDQLVTQIWPGAYNTFGFSPDGTRLAFEGPGTGNPAVWSSTLTGGDPRRMTGAPTGTFFRAGGHFLFSVPADSLVPPGPDNTNFVDGDGVILYSGEGEWLVFTRLATPPDTGGGGGGGGPPEG
jgi:hypothetical protein